MSERVEYITNAKWLAHVFACVRAIDSIGGDPAMVGELVEALRFIAGDDDIEKHMYMGAYTRDQLSFSEGTLAMAKAHAARARALLARIQPKEPSNG